MAYDVVLAKICVRLVNAVEGAGVAVVSLFPPDERVASQVCRRTRTLLDLEGGRNESRQQRRKS